MFIKDKCKKKKNNWPYAWIWGRFNLFVDEDKNITMEKKEVKEVTIKIYLYILLLQFGDLCAKNKSWSHQMILIFHFPSLKEGLVKFSLFVSLQRKPVCNNSAECIFSASKLLFNRCEVKQLEAQSDGIILVLKHSGQIEDDRNKQDEERKKRCELKTPDTLNEKDKKNEKKR